MSTDINQRVKWLDILRGFATILVVVGHSETEIFSRYIFWFHMPLFFLLSGFFFKSLNSTNEIKPFVIKRTRRLLIPYFSYLTATFILFQLPTIFIHHTDLPYNLTHFFILLLIGGRAIGGLYGVYWFFTCLLITQIVFAVIHTNIKSIRSQLLIIFILYFFAHIEANYIKAGFMDSPIPWNADVSMFALIFYAFGFYTKDLLDLKKSNTIKILSITMNINTLGIISIIFSAIFITLKINGIIDYNLDLKNVIYNSILLDFIIPATFILSTIFVAQLSLPDSVKTILSSIGTNSLPIIFLHIPVRYAIDMVNNSFVHTNSELTIIYIILGIVLPFFLNTLIFRKISFIPSIG